MIKITIQRQRFALSGLGLAFVLAVAFKLARE
jgi:hypothetical protein